MSTLTYGIVEEKYTLNGQSRIAYGMALYANAVEDGTATIIASARDLTSDKARLEALVANCNRLELSSIHFDDVIEDFLVG